MATDSERIFIRLDPDNLTDDAIDDYVEQLWRALTSRLKGDSCP
jgi:phosphate uptake regulator